MLVFEVGLYENKLAKKYKLTPKYTRRIVALSAGKARYEYYRLLDLMETFGEFLPWVYCKKIGPANITDLFGDVEMFEHVKQHRNMPFIYHGMRIEVCGKPGVIVGAGSGANLSVVFDGKWHTSNCHPWYETVYYDNAGNVVADYRAKKAVANT